MIKISSILSIFFLQHLNPLSHQHIEGFFWSERIHYILYCIFFLISSGPHKIPQGVPIVTILPSVRIVRTLYLFILFQNMISHGPRLQEYSQKVNSRCIVDRIINSWKHIVSRKRYKYYIWTISLLLLVNLLKKYTDQLVSQKLVSALTYFI